MPFAYPNPAFLKLRIVERVAEGETVAAICAGPDMPCEGSVQVWRRRDPAFARDLAAAHLRGDFRRRYPYDEAVARAFLARVAAGELTAAVLDTPGAPSQRAYASWRRMEPEFAAEVTRLTAARYWNRRRSGHARWKAWSEPVADRILLAVMRGARLRRLLASDPSLPCLAVTARWRREHPEWDGALKLAMKVGRMAREDAWSREGLTAELFEEIGDGIVLGGSLRSLGARADMPCPRTLYKWVARWPDFAAEVERCSVIREYWFTDQIIDGALANGPIGFVTGRRSVDHLQRQLNRLAKRPGWKRRRAAAAAP